MEGSKEKQKGGKEKKKSVRLAVGGANEQPGGAATSATAAVSGTATTAATAATAAASNSSHSALAPSGGGGGGGSGGGGGAANAANAGGAAAVKPQRSPLLFLSRRIGKSSKKKGGPVDTDNDEAKLAPSGSSSSSIAAAAVGDSTASQLSLTKQTTRLPVPVPAPQKPRKGISKVFHDLRYRSIRHPKDPKDSKISKSRSAPLNVGAMDNGSARSLVSDDGDTFSSVYATPMQSEAPSSGYSTPTVFSSGVGSPTDSLSESLIEEEQEQHAALVKDQVVAAVDAPSGTDNSNGYPKNEHLYKVLVIGELGTGKTSIIKRYVHQFFSQHYRATIGVDFALKVVHWDQNTVIRLQLWDIAGQERFGNMTRVYYKEAVGAFIVFDVTRTSTFESVAKWKQDLDAKVQLPDGSPIPCVLLANKCDQPKEGIVATPGKLDEYCKEKGFAGWFETSAKDNINIDDAAKFLVGTILQNDQWNNSVKEEDGDKLDLNGGGSPPEKKSGCC